MYRVFFWLGIGALAAAQSIDAPAFVAKYCAGCHNDKLKSGAFNWTKVDLAHPDQTAAEAEKAIHMLDVGMMPPPGVPRPDAPTLRAFADTLAARIDQAAQAHPNPGTPALHRLNRTEYHNAIRDLLGLDVDVSALLPADDMSHGFDNMADVLTISPALMEGYIRAAGKISRLAVGDSRATPVTTTFQIPKVVNQMRRVEGAPYGTRGGISTIYNFPADGEYVFKTLFYHDIDGPFWGKNLGKGQQLEISINGERVALMTLDPNMMPTDTRQTEPIKVKAGPQRVSAAFLQKFDGPIEDFPTPVENVLIDTTHADIPGLTSLPHLREFSIIGPSNVTGVSETPSRRAILACQPAKESDEIPCAKKIIARLARVAYRRPASDSDAEDLLSFFQKGRNQGGNFDSGVQAVVQTILSDPEFVFRFERMPAGTTPGSNYRISDLELASRLSFFLWSSVPDDTLVALGSQNKLHEPAVLEQQVRRMLHDPKSEALSKVFAYEWLHLQNLNDVQPDAFLFPNFDKNLVASMTRETELLFDSIVHEDRSVLDLMKANYTFVDEILAKHYGIPNILGTRFRRVALTDETRFGLLGQSSILTLTSVSDRTSPVQRGKYVMQVLLGTPPPPPPPGAGKFAETEDPRPKSMRERMEIHRKVEPCHSCHQLMDPIGLALENFDGIGQWRTLDAGLPIDASSKMFDGEKLDGPVSLRKAILNHSDVFLSTFVQNLLAYGLGRVVDYHEMPVVRAIQHDAAREGDKFSAVVLGIVKSTPFQMRRAETGGTN